MGKLAVRMCCGTAVIAAIIQIFVLTGEWYSAVQYLGPPLVSPTINYKYGLSTVRIEMGNNALIKFHGMGGQGFLSQIPWFANFHYCGGGQEVSDKIKKKKIAGVGGPDNRTPEQVEEEWVEFKGIKGGKYCCDISLAALYQHMNTDLWRTFHTLINPNFPLFGTAGMVMFFGGLVIIILGSFQALVLLLGAAFLFYYGERKSTKKARMIAVLMLFIAPILGIIIAVASIFIFTVTSMPTSVAPWMQLAFAKSPMLPGWAWITHIMNFIVVSALVCFSKFWKIKRVEKLRKEKKEREQEEEFFRTIGIDPDASGSSGSDAASTSSSDDSDDDYSGTTTVYGNSVYGMPAGARSTPYYVQGSVGPSGIQQTTLQPPVYAYNQIYA